MTPVLEGRGLHKHYGRVLAVDGVDISLPAGRCLGLLGPNGAGKTTTVEMLEGVLEPSAGEVLFHGAPLGATFRERAGVQFQSTALQQFITVREALVLFASMYERTTPMDELVALCALGEFLDRDVRKLSGGQRQRVLLAIALVNDPEIVFLDEPTTGLDPQARRNFWSLVQQIKQQGKTVLLTTHYMEEAYQLCDLVAIMDHGRIIAEGAPKSLLQGHFDHVVMELPGGSFDPAQVELPYSVLASGDTLQIHADDVERALVCLQHAGVPLDQLRIRPRTLEDLFIELTGRELRG